LLKMSKMLFFGAANNKKLILLMIQQYIQQAFFIFINALANNLLRRFHIIQCATIMS
jgi:hypothetical protein